MEHRKLRQFIAASAYISFLSFILVCVAFTSDHWIDGRAFVVNDTTHDFHHSVINYGLFRGSLIRPILSTYTIYKIYFTCVWEKNLCAWSCLSEPENRFEEVNALIKGEKPFFACEPMWMESSSMQVGDYYDQIIPNNDYNQVLLDGAMNVATIAFLFLTCVSLLICGVLGVLNFERCPRTTFLNLPGIYLSSVLAFTFNLTGLIVYGCFYDNWIKRNIGILDTIVGDYHSYAYLGSGYWLYFSGCVINPIAILLLCLRNILLKKQERAETVVVVARVNDPTTVLY